MEKRLKWNAGEIHRGLTVKQVMQRELGLTERQMARAKFLPEGICVKRGSEERQVTVRFVLEPGDVLAVKLEEKNRSSEQLIPMEGKPDIRYEDEDLLLVYKPAGLVVHPSPGHYGDSLANMLAWHYREQKEGLVVRPVGRLDKDTSGLLFFAKNAAAAYRLEKQRKSGRMKRFYLALVEGRPEPAEGTVEAALGSVPGEWMRQQVCEDGAWAKTDYWVKGSQLPEQAECEAAKAYSLVKLKLHTGRTHQIRVHMAHIGHPLLGDPMYGGEMKTEMERAALHSWRIELEQPFTGEALVFEAEPPEDMLEKMKGLSYE